MSADMRGAWAGKMRTRCLLWPMMACAFFCTARAQQATSPTSPRDWPTYGGQKADDHYSSLAQINRNNVGKLAVAWTYDTGDKGVGLQTSPLIVGRTLFGYSPTQKVIALDAATGKLLWSFDSGVQ